MLKKGQIWVETVIYTLIGLAILGILLALAKPKIDELKDRLIIEKSIEMLNNIEQAVNNIKYVPGNSRPIDVKIQRGNLIISGKDDYVEYYLENSNYKYSEPGQEIEIGNIKATTTENGKVYSVKLIRNYQSYLNLTWQGEDIDKELQPASTPYKIFASNKGGPIPNIDFS